MASRLHRVSNILYAPWRYGQRKGGVDQGSQRIQYIVNELVSNSVSLSPHSHTVFTNDNDNEQYHHELYKARCKCYDNTLVAGGDHSVAIGSLLGSLREFEETKPAHTDSRLGVIWIDAHADINTLESSESGNVHGMPLAFVTGIDDSWQWVNDLNLRLDFSDLFYWGIRDLDNFEIDTIDRYGIKVLSDKEEAMAIIDDPRYHRIHTSLDIDGLDPRFASSTGTRADNGLELKDVLDYIYYLKYSKKSIGFDLVEYNPDLGTEEEQLTTEQTVKALLHAIL